MSNVFRPMSPHIGIYKFPIAAIMSGAHRITGVLVYFYIKSIIWLIIFDRFFDIQIPLMIMKFVVGCYGFILMMLFVFGVFYHTFNGIRYLLWIFGKCYEVKKSNIIGIIGIFFTFLVMVLFFFLFRAMYV